MAMRQKLCKKMTLGADGLATLGYIFQFDWSCNVLRHCFLCACFPSCTDTEGNSIERKRIEGCGHNHVWQFLHHLVSHVSISYSCMLQSVVGDGLCLNTGTAPNLTQGPYEVDDLDEVDEGDHLDREAGVWVPCRMILAHLLESFTNAASVLLHPLLIVHRLDGQEQQGGQDADAHPNEGDSYKKYARSIL